MSWITITEAHIKGSLSPMEMRAFKAAAEQTSGGADPVPGVITRVTAEVRGAVAGCERNQLGEDGTVPDECLGYACDLAAWYIITAFGISDEKIIKTRQTKMENANKFLRDVAACKFRIAQPTSVSADVIPRSSLEKVSGNTRQATRQKMSGL